MLWITFKLYPVSNLAEEFGGTYQVYVLLNPFENLSLIQQSSIEIAICFDFLASKKTLDPNTIVESNNDNVVVSGTDQTVAIQILVGERVESATLEVNENRMKYRCHILGRCVNIEKKAIFGMIWIGTRWGGEVTWWSMLSFVSSEHFLTKVGQHTVSAIWTVSFTRGSAAALKRRSPTGGAAYLIPNHWLTPLAAYAPWYLEYPKSTVKVTLPAPVLFSSRKNSPRTIAGTNIRIKIIVKQAQKRTGCRPLKRVNFCQVEGRTAAILSAILYIQPAGTWQSSWRASAVQRPGAYNVWWRTMRKVEISLAKPYRVIPDRLRFEVLCIFFDKYNFDLSRCRRRIVLSLGKLALLLNCTTPSNPDPCVIRCCEDL